MFPEYIQDEFLSVPPESTDENDWNGAWDMLLNYYFPPAEHWVVVPQLRATRSLNDTLDLSINFKVLRDRIPVLFVELEAPAFLPHRSARALADAQMRRRIVKLYEASPTIFSGLSAFGTQVCKYTIDKETNIIKPRKITGDPERVTDVAPLEHWNIDLTTQKGMDRIVEIFTEAKNVALNAVRV